MNFFKKLIGLEKDLLERIHQFKARGSLYEVVKDTRNIKYFIYDVGLKNARSLFSKNLRSSIP